MSYPGRFPYAAWVWRYGLSLAATALALGGTYAAWPWVDRTPFALFFAATLVSAYVGGRGPGLLSVFLATCSYLFLIWFGIVDDGRLAPLVVFGSLAWLLSWTIVRRNESEATLRRSEAQLRTTFESAPIGMALVDMGGRPVRSNASLQRMLGYTPDELANLTFTEFTHPDDAATDWHLFQELIAGRRNQYQMEKRYYRADGTLVWGQLSVALLRDSDGRPSLALGMVEDITERKRAEEALRGSEGRLARILEIAQDAIISVDEHQRIILFNQGAEQIFGYQAREVLGHPLDILLPELFVDVHREHVQAFRTSSTPARRMGERQEVHGRHRDGTMFPAEASISKLEQNGRFVFTAILRDVSERRRADEALRQAEERLRLVVANLPIVLWALDREGRFTISEGRGLRLLGLNAGEVVGRAVTEVYATSPAVLDASRRALQGESVTFSVTLNDLTFECWYSPLHNGDGHIGGAIGVAIDVTERQRLHAQLLQSQKMEAIGRLAGGIAHDFNNLLTVIFGYSELLLAALAEDDPRREDLGEIRRAAASAAALTRQLLAFSRRQILQPVVLDLNATILNLEGMLQRLIGEDVPIELRLGPGLGCVHADPTQIEQVIMNLAANARDAMPNGGNLTIETSDVALSEADIRARGWGSPGAYVRLRISDTGEGMTPDVRARVFEPFFTTKEMGKGTGLGLSTVYGIVKQSGGFIAVESAPGQGTAFLIDFPLVEQCVADIANPQMAETATRGAETVLLVEDDEHVRDLTRRALERHGYRVLTASNADEALGLAMKHRDSIRLLLTDVVMPGLSGSELADRLLSNCPGLKVLYTSGYTEDAIVHHGVLRKGVSFLPKPFAPDTLTREVRRVLDTSTTN